MTTYVNSQGTNDVLQGTSGSDCLNGGGGNDALYGGGGNDVLNGGSGSDDLYGGSGSDDMYGGSGSDDMSGGSGNDDMSGGSGNDDMSGDSGNDDMYGGSGNDDMSGGSGNDDMSGDSGNDDMYGGSGNDTLCGGAGDDWLFGGAGNDYLFGGAGNDVLVGDDGWYGWDGWCWSYKASGYADYLDGGSGNDLVLCSRGNDSANYTYSENCGARDAYFGGRGFDTLYLTLTYGEAQLCSVQQDIARFEAWLHCNADTSRDWGRDFQFCSFNLTVDGFEKLVVNKVNTAPVASDDTGAIDEDHELPGNVLANDSDADNLDVLEVVPFEGESKLGAKVKINADGSYTYDPTAVRDLQMLGAGETTKDTFSYTVRDLGGKTAAALVEIAVTGVNDVPVPRDDAASTDEDKKLEVDADKGLLANDRDPDHLDVLKVVPFTSVNARGATLEVKADGSYTYNPTTASDLDEGEVAEDIFSYTVVDLAGATATADLRIIVTGVDEPSDGQTIVGDAEGTMLVGGVGNDTLIGHGGNDSLEGGPGDDTLFGDAPYDEQGIEGTLDGVKGTDDSARYTGSRGEYHLTRSGNELLVADVKNKSTDALRDIEKVEFDFGGQANLVLGTDAHEDIFGSPTDDYIFAGGGDDTIDAGDGIDVVVWSLGDGNDTLVDGGAADDELQLNVTAEVWHTISVTLPDPDGDRTVTGGTGGHSFSITLRNFEALTRWYQDELGNWIGGDVPEAASGPVSFSADEFSYGQVDQEPFDSGAPDAPVDFLI